MNKFYPVCEPFLNGNEEKYLLDAVKSGWISSSGRYIDAFEKEFAKYCGVDYAVSVCNGTQAIHLALVALGIGIGDEVIIPNFTMIATAYAVCYTGATPVFVDADSETWNIDTNKIEEKITKKTKAIIPVHLFGLPCNMKKIIEITKKHNLFLIEDAAEAHGAEIDKKRMGSLSDIAAFSFYANKNLTTGEGGIIVTNDHKLYEKCKYYKNLCFKVNGPRDFIHNDVGFNYRMSNLHAAIGLAQVEKADKYRKMRIENGLYYRDLLENIPGIIFQKKSKYKNVYWMNALKINRNEFGTDRETILTHLANNKIGTRILFQGMNKQPSLLNYSTNEVFSVSDDLYENGFYLPSSTNLSKDDIKFICNKLLEVRNVKL